MPAYVVTATDVRARRGTDRGTEHDMTLRGVALGAVVAAMPLTLLVSTSPATQAEPGSGVTTADRRAPRYEATVTRTRHGIPHVVARDWGSLGFGHGYATAETNLCNLADTVVTGR